MTKKLWAMGVAGQASKYQGMQITSVETPSTIAEVRTARPYWYLAAVLGLSTLLVACVTPAKNQDDGSTVQTEVGVSGCSGCIGINTFTSRTLASELYAVKDADGMRTGQRISASLKLGITNRKSGVKGGLFAAPNATAYLAEITGPEAHMFQGETPTDANHPYRFLLRIHNNSSFTNQNVQLVAGEIYRSLPSMSLEGVDNAQNCFSSGCTWDADYVISAKVINSHIATDTPLTIFIGNRVSKQVQSKDGLNATYETVSAGAFLRVTPEQLKSFVAAVRQRLAI